MKCKMKMKYSEAKMKIKEMNNEQIVSLPRPNIICCYWRRKRPQLPAEISKLNALLTKSLFSEVRAHLGTITERVDEHTTSATSNFSENKYKNTGPLLYLLEKKKQFSLENMFFQSCDTPTYVCIINSI